MKNRVASISLAVMLALSVGLVGCGQAQSTASPAICSASEGNVSVMKEGTASWVEAEVGMALEPADIIKCSNNSTAQITFLDGSTIELQAGTEIEVVSLNISTETGSSTIRLKQTIGSIIFRVTKIIDPASRYEVETPVAAVVVRGSAVQITVSEDGTTRVCNLQGDIWAIAQGVELQVPEGRCCVIRPSQPPELIVELIDPNLEAVIREKINKPAGDIYRSDLEGITSLNAMERNITDLTGLEYATSLTYLMLGDNQISDISPLADLTNLTVLWLWSNQISDIAPLANLTNLTELVLTANPISDISPLAKLISLTYLVLEGNHQVSDISPLANLVSLTVLYLGGTQVSDISPLADLVSLTYLELGGTQVSDISPLANLVSLTYLNLYNSQISDILPLANLTSLTGLILGFNQISDISSLASLTNLTDLSLEGNQISDISPLVENQGISAGDDVTLRGNPLSSDSINIYIPQLQARGVTVYY